MKIKGITAVKWGSHGIASDVPIQFENFTNAYYKCGADGFEQSPDGFRVVDSWIGKPLGESNLTPSEQAIWDNDELHRLEAIKARNTKDPKTIIGWALKAFID